MILFIIHINNQSIQHFYFMTVVVLYMRKPTKN